MIKMIVLGAGLAGLYAAYGAASNGADVELVEKSTIGTRHNSGELYTEIYMAAPKECTLNRITKMNVTIEDKIVNIMDLGADRDVTPFVMTDKCSHELYIMKKCVELGVNVKQKTVLTKADTKGKYIIDATGISSYKGDMGKAVDYIIKRSDKYLVDEDEARFYIRDDLMGYSWVFPKSDNLLNVGEGVYDYRYNTKFSKPDKKLIVASGGGLLPMPTMDEYYNRFYEMKYHYMRCLKVGNAGGLINPCAGGGEHLAALSGLLAGSLVAHNKEDKYSIALNEIIGDEMRIGISLYEFMKKQDMASVKKLFEEKLIIKRYGIETMNSTVRKAMAKWIKIPDVSEDDLKRFVCE